MSFSYEVFIRAETKLAPVAYLPEIQLYQAENADAIWRAVAKVQGEEEPPFPFWAFPWAGGLGLARFILDEPDYVRGKRVLAFACGSGVDAIAAAKAGAKSVASADIDLFAVAATKMNAAANDVAVTTRGAMNLDQTPKGYDVIIAGDIFYEQRMSIRLLRWLRLCASEGITVLMGDPGRAYVPEEGVERLAALTVPTSRELEDKDSREVTIWHILG